MIQTISHYNRIHIIFIHPWPSSHTHTHTHTIFHPNPLQHTHTHKHRHTYPFNSLILHIITQETKKFGACHLLNSEKRNQTQNTLYNHLPHPATSPNHLKTPHTHIHKHTYTHIHTHTLYIHTDTNTHIPKFWCQKSILLQDHFSFFKLYCKVIGLKNY